VVAGSVEMLSGRNKKDYAAESAADALTVQAAQLGGDTDASPEDNADATEPEVDESADVAA